MSNQAFSKIWIIVIAVVIIIGGIFAWQYFGAPKEETKTPEEVAKEATEDETANWKTYKDEEYGFELKYPKGWMYEQSIFLSKPNLVFCPLSLTEVHAEETICKLKTGASKPQYEDGMIYLFNYTSDPKPNNSDYRYVGIDHLGYYYYLYSSVSGNESVINQMLATFKFIEVTKQAEEVSKEEKYCETDTDCACGVNKKTRECFYGNKDYVDTAQQCPDFCTGIGANLIIKCIDNECKKVSGSLNE